VRRFVESLAWLLIGLMFLYTVLQSFGIIKQGPEDAATVIEERV
jgi:uncharacterized membrane protein